MLYPNKRQWWVIWITDFLISLLIYLHASESELDKAFASHAALIILITASLLVWRLSDRK